MSEQRPLRTVGRTVCSQHMSLFIISVADKCSNFGIGASFLELMLCGRCSNWNGLDSTEMNYYENFNQS